MSNKIKRPMNAYFFFLKDKRSDFKANHPDLKSTEIVKSLNKQWIELAILWLVPNENMKKFVDEQIKSYNWKLEQHHIEIFNGLLPTCTCRGNNEIEWVQQYIANKKKWTMPIQNSNTAIAHFMIKFEDRINLN